MRYSHCKYCMWWNLWRGQWLNGLILCAHRDDFRELLATILTDCCWWWFNMLNGPQTSRERSAGTGRAVHTTQNIKLPRGVQGCTWLGCPCHWLGDPGLCTNQGHFTIILHLFLPLIFCQNLMSYLNDKNPYIYITIFKNGALHLEY